MAAVFVEERLDDAVAQPDGVDRAGHTRGVAEQHAVGAVDADDPRVVIRAVFTQPRADADAMNRDAQLGGRLRRIAGQVVDAVGKHDHRGDLGRGKLFCAGLHRPSERGRLAVGDQRGELLAVFQRPRAVGEGDLEHAEIAGERRVPLVHFAACPIETRYAG